MLELLRLMTQLSSAARWTAIFIAAVIAVFVAYTGIAMCATFRACDPEQRKVRYQVFRDLLRWFGRGGSR
jgi:hypothetical protein